MRLKPAGIFIILLVVGVLAYFALKPRLADIRTQNNSELPNSTQGQNNQPSGSRNEEPAPTATTGNNTEDREFNFDPEKPQNGSLRGVVEVGATGFNSFVINMDAQKRWEIVSKDFGESLAYEGLATADDIRVGLKRYLSSMFDKGVAKNNMHFVISSGAQKEPKTSIIAMELQKLGYVVNLVTPEQEARYALQATIPPQYRNNSFMVDIGSGNTKISWAEDGSIKAMELPGAKYYEKEMSDASVYEQVREKANGIPTGKRNVGFILGGVPFTLAKQHRKGEERYTVLRAPGAYKAADKKMASGLNIYKGIADATNTDTFVFDWDANFTIGFLLNLNR